MLMVPRLASVNLIKPASYGASVRIQFFGQVELEFVDQRRSVEEPPPQVVLGPARPGLGSVGHRPGQSRGTIGRARWGSLGFGVPSTAGGDLVSWACYIKLVVYLLIGEGLSKGHSTTSPEKNIRGWCHALGDLALLIGAGPSHQAPDVIVNPASGLLATFGEGFSHRRSRF